MTNEDQKINEMLEENHICAICGGKTFERADYNEDIDEDQYLTICEDCGAEEA